MAARLPRFLAAASLLALGLAPARAPGSGHIQVTVSLSADRVVLVPRDGAYEVHVSPAPGERFGRLDEPGEAALPFRIIEVLLPAGTEVADTRVTGASERLIAEGIALAPSAAAAADPRRAGAGLAAAAPEASTGYPGERARYLGTGLWHGRAIASFAVFPVERRGEDVVLHDRIALEVSLRPSDRPQPVRALRMSPAHAARLAAQVRASVVNPGAERLQPVATPARHEGTFRPAVAPSLEGSPVEYVIITTGVLAPEFQRLADWKTAKGVPTVVRTIDWIAANYRNGSDLPETIRNFIRDAYEKWGVRWVLLGGDTPEIPPRYGYSAYYYGGTYVLADLYFSGLDGDWNADHDAVWGEQPADAPDLHGEVYVGRLPVSSTMAAANVIDKVIRYEKAVDREYADKLLFLAEVLFPAPWNEGDPIQQNGAVIATFIHENFDGGSMRSTRMYETSSVYPGSVQESRQAVLDSLEAGYNLVFHVGHGYRFNMHCADESVTIPDADALRNGERTFNLYMLNCTAAAYDFDCLAEHFLANMLGGAVSAIGANNSAFADVAAYYADDYAGRVVAGSHIGEAFHNSRLARTPLAMFGDNADLWTHYIYTMLADPEMPLWTGPVDTLAVSHDASVVAGVPTINVNVTAGGMPVDSAIVCLWKPGEDYQVLATDALGSAAFSFACETAGSVSVVVTARNLAPYEGTVAVVAQSPPYLSVSATAVDDDGVDGTTGNGDGVIDAGETIDFAPVVRNSGGGASGASTLALATTSPHVTIQAPVAAAGPVVAGGSLAAQSSWRLQVAAGAPDGAIAEFTVLIADGTFGPWVDTFARVLHAPALEFTTVRVDDAPGNGDGTVTAGEPFHLFCGVKNYGSGAAPGLSAVIHSLDGGAVVSDSTDVYPPQLAALAEAENSGGFLLDETSVAVENAIEIVVTDAYGRSVSDTLELRAPLPPSALLFDAGLGVDRLGLSWDASASTDVDRYYVYRSLAPGGPFTRVTADAVHHTLFIDGGLSASTRYYYYVTAIDAAGNPSTTSPVASASTNAPQLTGWPATLPDASTSSPVVGDIDSDGDLEVVIGSDLLYAWHADGQEVLDGDEQALTWGVFSDLGVNFVGPPALANLDGDFGLEIAAAALTSREVYCFRGTGEVLPGWPRPTINDIRAGVLVADLDGDDLQEIIAVDHKGYLYAWDKSGVEWADGDANPATDGVFRRFPTTQWWQYQMPSAADIDGDGAEEILIATQDSSLYVLNGDGSDVPGWPRRLPDFAGGGLAIGDIDDDGDLEIVVPVKNAGQVFALHHDNTVLWMRYSAQNLFFNPSPALADLDGDGRLETIIPSSNRRLYVFGPTGTDMPGWPQFYSATNYTQSSPLVADIDGDGGLDILLGDEGRFINAWSAAGVPLDGFPLVTKDAVRGTPAIVDLDQNGTVEILAAGFDRTLYVWNLSAPYDKNRAPWPVFHANSHRNALYAFQVPTAVGDDHDRPPAPIVSRLEQNYPNPFNPTTTIVFHVGAGEARRVTLVVYDVTGARVRTLVDEVLPEGRQLRPWDGTNDHRARVGSGIYFYRLRDGDLTQTKKMLLLK
jgi:hypothetical protein